MSNQQLAMEEGSLKSAANVTRMAMNNFNTEGTALRNHIEGMAGGWVGQGGSAFQALAREWGERQRRISQLLDTLADQLERTEQDSFVNDSEVASEIQKQASAMDTARLD